MYRITTQFSGPLVNGGGIQQFYFEQAGGTGTQAHAAVVAFWNSARAYMHTSVLYTVLGEIEYVDQASGQLEGMTTTDAVNSAGSSVADPLPPATQLLVRWRTGVYMGGREVRGRTFIPGTTRNSMTGNGVVVGTTITGLNTAAGNLIGDGNSILAIYSRTHGLDAEVVSGSTWGSFATLRSRRD